MKIASDWHESIIARRIVAKGIDLILVAMAMTIFYPFGSLAGILYMLLSDMLFSGRSIGKKLLDLAVVTTKEIPLDRYQLVLRNLLFTVTLFFLSFPIIGWILFFTVGILFIFFEMYLMIANENNQRLGDIMAHTKVVVTK